eukprot:5495896-Amphidinium_carterae.2
MNNEPAPLDTTHHHSLPLAPFPQEVNQWRGCRKDSQVHMLFVHSCECQHGVSGCTSAAVQHLEDNIKVPLEVWCIPHTQRHHGHSMYSNSTC